MNTSFGVGNVLATGFRIWARNFVSFAIISALINAPVIIWGLSAAGGDLSTVGQYLRWGTFLGIALGVLMSSTITYGSVMSLQGQRASVGSCLSVGLRSFFPAVGVLLLLILCFIGVYLATAFPMGVVVAAARGYGSIIAFAIVVGAALMWLYTMMFVAMQVVVIERPGIAASLGRSRDLTMGHKWALFAVCFVLFGANFGVEYLAQKLTSAEGHFQAYIYFGLVRTVLFGSISATMSAAAYYLLRSEKEGTSADELAQIFG